MNGALIIVIWALLAFALCAMVGAAMVEGERRANEPAAACECCAYCIERCQK